VAGKTMCLTARMCGRQDSRISMQSAGRRSTRAQPTTRAQKASVAKMAFDGLRLVTVS